MPEPSSSSLNLDAARSAGKTDEEILGHLAKIHGFDIEAAHNVGKTDDEILQHLASKPFDVTKPVPGMEKLVPPGQPAQPPNNPLQAPAKPRPMVPEQPVPGLTSPDESLTSKILRGVTAAAPMTTMPLPRPKTPPPDLGDIAGQAKEQMLFSGPGKVLTGTQQLGKSGERLAGATNILKGINEAAEPLALVGGAHGLVTAPARTAASLAGWSLAGPAAQKTTQALGRGPEAQEFAGELATSPVTAHLAGKSFKPLTKAVSHLDSLLLKTEAGQAISAKLVPAIDYIKTKANPSLAWLRYATVENFDSLSNDPKIQTQIRAATSEVGKTLAQHQIVRDRPAINDAMREAGLAPEAFDQTLQHSRLQGKEADLRSRAQAWANIAPNEITESNTLPMAKDLHQNYGTKTHEAVKDIFANDLTRDEHFYKWLDENFEKLDNGNVKSGNGTELTTTRARQLFDHQVDEATNTGARSLQADRLAQRFKSTGMTEPGPDENIHDLANADQASAEQLAAKGLRTRDLFSRTYHGLAGAVRNNRETYLPLKSLHGMDFEQLSQHPAFQKALSLYKFGKSPEELTKVLTDAGLNPDTTDPETLKFLRASTGGTNPGLSSIEGLYRQHHANLEGAEGNLGPLDTYYPLLAEGKSGSGPKKFTDLFKSRWQPFNPANFHTAGLSKYSTDVGQLTRHLGSMIYQGRKAAAMKTLSSIGDIKEATEDNMVKDSLGNLVPPPGYQKLPIAPDVYEKIKTPVGQETVKHPGKTYLAPYQLARELTPWITGGRYRGSDTAGVDPMHIAESALGGAIKTNLLGPNDNINYLARVWAGLGTQLGKLPSSDWAKYTGPIRPLVEGLRTTFNAGAIDPHNPGFINDFRTAINEGALSPRYARATGDKQLAKDTGIAYAPNVVKSVAHDIVQGVKDLGQLYNKAKGQPAEFPTNRYTNPVESLDSFLYGPLESSYGLDARVRMSLWYQHKKAFPNATPQERAGFVNAIGNYNQTMQSALERNLSGSLLGMALAPFIQTGSAFYRTGVHTALGARVLPASQPFTTSGYLASQLSTGSAGYLTAWAATNYALNGQYPWDDPQGAKVGAVKLPPGMVSALRPWLGDQQGKPIYIDALRAPYIFADKGMQALGIRGALNEAMTQNRGTGEKGLANLAQMVKTSIISNDARAQMVFWNGFAKDAANALIAPASMGPATAGLAAAAGRAPYISRWTPHNGAEFLNIHKPTANAGRDIFNTAGRAVSAAAGLGFLSDQAGFTADTDRLDKSKMSPVGSAIYNMTPAPIRPWTANPAGQTKRDWRDIKGINRQGLKQAEKDRLAGQ